MAKYYFFMDKQYGPYELSDLQTLINQRRFNQDCWVFHKDETSDWTRAGDIASLQGLFQTDQNAPPADSVTPPKPTATLNEKDETLLVSASKADSIRPLETNLPSAPLSDLGAQSKVSFLEESDDTGLLGRIKKIIGLS